jgi:hypothetical protein
MATDRRAVLSVLVAAALLLWPALWNGYPIVFADTGTYLSQALHLYAGWDRPVFYSLFMLPLHGAVTTWPVIAVQALLTAGVLRVVCRVLRPGLSERAFVAGVAGLSVCTWLPWMVCELMPDVFTPLLVLVLSVLALAPERVSGREQVVLVVLAAFMIASQQSSLPLSCALIVVLAAVRQVFIVSMVSWPGVARPSTTCDDRGDKVVDGRARPGHDTNAPARPGRVTKRHATASAVRRWRLFVIPPALAALALCSVNLGAHGRFEISPFGNVFLLARVIYDGPGMAALQRACPASGWHLCPFIGRFPPQSDDFMWSPDSPLNLAGGAKAVSRDADAIIADAVASDPAGIARAALSNTLEQLRRFASGDGLEAWPDQVTPWIERDFPPAEQAAYAAALQQRGLLAVPPVLAALHRFTALGGLAACGLLVPAAIRRRAACTGFLIATLVALPLSAAITGELSTPHDRYQSRIMWLPPFIAAVSLASLRRGSPDPRARLKELLAPRRFPASG